MLDRRNVTLGAALALSGMALVNHGAAAQSASNPPAKLVGTDPAKLLLMGQEGGAFLLQTARLGMEKATRAEVKRFAQFEANEQEALVRSMQLADHGPSTPRFTGEKAELLEQLRTNSGPAFEEAFLKAQVMGHEEALNVFTAIAETASAAAADKIVATLTTSRVQEHLIDLGLLRKG